MKITKRDVYASVLLSEIKVIFDLIQARRITHFYGGESLGLSDFCIAAFYLSIIDLEPTLMPLVLDNYPELKPYF